MSTSIARRELEAATLREIVSSDYATPSPNADAQAAYDEDQLRIAALNYVQALIRAGDIEPGLISDGYHTFEELYRYRMLYNAHAAAGWHAAGIPVVKSYRHHDGQECFGGGWFIVVATLPEGQVSNHYRNQHWDLFAVPEVELAPEYDGHTPAQAADRLHFALIRASEARGMLDG